MHRGPFFVSLGLHILLGLAMIWASGMSEANQKALPQATVVRLIQPASINVPPPSKPTNDLKLPEPKPKKEPKEDQVVAPDDKKPLEIPTPKKDKEPADQTPKSPGGKGSMPNVPKELVGEGVTLKLNGAGFEYDFYLGIVQSKIQQNFRPPPGRKSAMAVVSFVILKTGETSNIQLQQPSGSLLVDQAAQRAVRAAGRFPPLPAQYGSDQLAINIEFVANPGTNR
jgi:protein TonB